MLVPHIVRSQLLDASNLRTIDTGVGQSIELRRVPADAPAATQPGAPETQPAAPPVRPAGSQRSSAGSVPGATAQAAAPVAMAQMRAAADANSTPPGAPPPGPPPGPQGQKVNLVLSPQPGPVTAGSTFRVNVTLNGGADIAALSRPRN